MESNVLAVGIAEAARRLSVCARTITNLIATKELPSRKIGRRRVIPVAALESFLRRDHEISITKTPRLHAAVDAGGVQ
jgi:excisionase family DNA binding protein